jgi:hypothetical protein
MKRRDIEAFYNEIHRLGYMDSDDVVFCRCGGIHERVIYTRRETDRLLEALRHHSHHCKRGGSHGKTVG